MWPNTPVAKDKEHGVDDVALAAPVGAHDGGEALVKRAQHLFARIRLEEVVLNVGYDQPKKRTFLGTWLINFENFIRMSVPYALVGTYFLKFTISNLETIHHYHLLNLILQIRTHTTPPTSVPWSRRYRPAQGAGECRCRQFEYHPNVIKTSIHEFHTNERIME